MKSWLRHGLGLAGAGAGLLGLTAQEPLHFENLQTLANRELLLRWRASAGLPYRIDVSADLQQWDPFLTLRSAGADQHTDSAAPYHPQRFYSALAVGDSNVLTGDHLLTAAGDAILHPVNHATLLLRWQGRMIYVDPVGGAAPFQGFARADLILITHSHGDHWSSATVDAVRTDSSGIVASTGVFSAMSAAQRAQTTVLTNGASAQLLGLSIEATPAYNLTATQHPKGVGNGYVLTLGGRRIYVAGDTEDTPDMRALTGIDVAFVPMNQPYTMTVAKAVSAVRAFRPKVVYPYHYRNADSSYADLAAFKQQVGTDLGIEVRLRSWY